MISLIMAYWADLAQNRDRTHIAVKINMDEEGQSIITITSF
jgi:hypothetical protein